MFDSPRREMREKNLVEVGINEGEVDKTVENEENVEEVSEEVGIPTSEVGTNLKSEPDVPQEHQVPSVNQSGRVHRQPE